MLKHSPGRTQALIERIRGLDSDTRQQLFGKLHQAGVNVARLPIVPVCESGPLPLSYAQQRQWFLWQLEPQSSAYNISSALRLTGELDRAALHQSFSQLVARHASLRTRFIEQADGVRQVVLDPAQVEVALDVRESPLDDTDAAIRQCLEEEAARPFDLLAGPLMHVRLLPLADADHVLVVTLHHIVTDGWSMGIIVEELLALYAAHRLNETAQLPALAVNYVDYAQWQRQWLASGEQARQLAYWQAQLSGDEGVLELPLDHPRPAVQSYRGASVSMNLAPACAEALKALAQRHDTSLFSVLLAAFQTLLHRYTGRSDIRVGVPVANRNRLETERVIGFFVNTQVLKATVDGLQPFDALLRQVSGAVQDAQAHQDLPFDQLVEALHPERSLSHSPLFQVMYNHQNRGADLTTVYQLGSLRAQALTADEQSAQFDLSLDTQETAHGITAVWSYATDLFEHATVERFARHWAQLLDAIIARPTTLVGELPLLDEREYRQLTQDWGCCDIDYPSALCVHQLFEQQARRLPDNAALLFEKERLSYAELNAHANRLARHLRTLGVGPEVLVGIATERGLNMVIGLLAVLKAGGGYVPLDPQYPADRLHCMIEDSGTHLVLTQQLLLDRLPIPADVRSVCLDQSADWDALEAHDLESLVQPENLAYVMFTSGSTGRPKGVGISHACLTRHAYVSFEFFGLSEADRMLQFATFNFDGFVEQLYPPLICGASVLLRGTDIWDSDTFYRQLIDQRISVVDLTTAYWHMIAKEFAAVGPRDYGVLRQVHSGGEAMPPEGLHAWREAGLGGVKLLNTYGPTEATVTATTLDCSGYVNGETPIPLTLPIGRVLPGRSVYLLDDNGLPVPIGVVGELVIGGELLARGYFQRPGLSAERFLPDPFSGSGARLYRTGDLARFNAEGVIEYVGRIDHQVKIRGFRIELGEIEARLLEQDVLGDALVLAVPGANGLQLVAYVVAKAHTPESELREQIQRQLKDHLPDYMVPAYILFLDHLPLSPNGKLDRKALPSPDANQLQEAFVAPRSEQEQAIAGIWQDVLNIAQVGLTDNFFALGGHSLLAVQVMSRLRVERSLTAPLRLIFEQPVLQGFVAALNVTAGSPDQPPMQAINRDGPLALSYAQERQWFLWRLDPHSAAYHIPSALRLKGPLDHDALHHSFAALVRRHESLRTTFGQNADGTFAQVHAHMHLAIDTLPLTPEQSTDDHLLALVAAETAALFDLQHGPLLRVKLMQIDAEDHVLVLTQHHIVSDGWSMQIMVEELLKLYGAFSAGQSPQLSPLPVQYADYAHWQREWMDAGERDRQLAYWIAQLSVEEGVGQPVLELPTDRPRPAVQSHHGASLDLAVPEALSRSLKQLAQAQQSTLFVVLLASFQVLLHRYSGQTDLRVGVPVANRNRVETEGLIGFFVNTQVHRASVEGSMPFDALLQQVRRAALDAQSHQDLPFEQLVEALHPERSLSHSPLFQVMYNHQNETRQRVAEWALPGLEVSGLAWDNDSAQFDLTLDTVENAQGIFATLTYATDLFEAGTVKRLGEHWLNLLQAIAADPGLPVGELAMLSPDEKDDLQRGSLSGATYATDTPVQVRIQAHAELNPEAVALLFGDAQMSYGELEARANRLAHHLRATGVGPEVLVGIALDRGMDMIVALLAVLKAGAAYVPLDPEYPADRLAYLMQDSGIALLLTDSSVIARLPAPVQISRVLLDSLDLKVQPSSAPVSQPDPDHLAYVIYTSGSTGQPKGVTVAHGPLAMHCQAVGERYAMTEADCELHFMSFAFDGAHERWLTALSHGGRLLIRDRQLWTPEQTLHAMHRHGVTVAAFPPVYLQQLAEQALKDGNPPPVRIYCFGGDAVPQASFERVKQALRPQFIINGYGPTETVVTPLIWKADANTPCGAAYAPIGTRIGDRTLAVLDDSLQPVPQGHSGELYLGGVGVARGYLNRPGLTAERFVPDLYSTTGGRAYRSGDRVSQRADGVIDYLSRIDHQVKVRGFRIELGEIEARLRAHPAVRDAVVVAQTGEHGTQLVGYVVAMNADAGNDDTPEQHALRDQINLALKAVLPGYMVPSYLVFLPRMPLSPNGKLDRKALPKADPSLMQRAYVAPANELERRIAAIWQQVLKLPQVGRDDNFFELGGHSLLATQVTATLQMECAADVPLDLMFKAATLHEYASAVSECLNSNVEQDLSDLHDLLFELETH